MTLRYVRDLTAAAWIASRLHPFAQDAGAIVPEGFEAYARVFHPVVSRVGERVATWREIAAANGRVAHREMQFASIAWSATHRPGGPDWVEPRTGTLAPDLAATLAAVLAPRTASPARCWFAVWEGWGGLDLALPRFELPGRAYFLAVGDVADARRSVYPEGFGHQSPSLWWPDDRAWCVATEIDLDSTYVGGSADCIAALLAHPDIEALPAELADEITYAGDAVNPMAPDVR